MIHVYYLKLNKKSNFIILILRLNYLVVKFNINCQTLNFPRTFGYVDGVAMEEGGCQWRKGCQWVSMGTVLLDNFEATSKMYA